MNDRPKPSGQSDHWSLNHFPQSGVPDLVSIQHECARERRAKLRKASTVVAIVLLSGLSFAFLHQPGNRRINKEDAMDFAQTKVPIVPRTASGIPVPSDLELPIPRPPTPATGFTLYADVEMDTPIFRYDDHRDAMVPVGWIRSTDTIPVDLKGLSNDQIETFQTILHSEPANEYF